MQLVGDFRHAGEITWRIVPQRLGREAKPARLVKKRLGQAVLGEGQKDAFDLARQMPGQAEHLPFGPAVKRGSHQMDDA